MALNAHAKRQLLWAVIVAITAIGLCYFLRSVIFHTDDAFITYQFARSIASGHGYVYHEGFQPLQGSSSPLHVMVLALLGALTPLPLDEVGYALGALGAGLLSAVFFCVQQESGTTTTKESVLAAAASATFLVPAWLSFGLETVWAGLMLVACMIAIAKIRLGWAVWAGVTMVLIRPDWGWFVPPLALLAGLRMGWRSVLWFAAPLLALLCFFLWSWFSFGEALPFSWIAKLEIPAEVSGTVSWLQFMQSYNGVAFLLFFCSTVALVGWILNRRGERSFLLSALLVLLCWSLLYTAVLAYKGAPNMPWYYISTIVIAGLATMVASKQLSAPLRVAVLALFVVSNTTALWSISERFSTGIDRRGANDRREHAGRWLASNDTAASIRSVVAYEVGKIAYYSGAKVYDVLGLVSREGVEGMKLKDPGLLVRKLRPDYVVGCECPGYLPMSFNQEPIFRREYEVVFSKDDYRVWRRRTD